MDFFLKMALPGKWVVKGADWQDLRRYRRIWRFSTILTLLVAVVPLMIMSGVNYYLYGKTLRTEIRFDISRDLSNISRSLKYIVGERLSVLQLLIMEKSPAEMFSEKGLENTFQNLRKSFGGFVDLGMIDSNGDQEFYSGPYDLAGINYRDQDWYKQVVEKDVYVSDVFMGHRQEPHFVIAVRRISQNKDSYILRVTVDMELLNKWVFIPHLGRSDDVFIVNKNGVLQTNSRLHGELLEQCSLPVPPFSPHAEIIEDYDEEGKSYVLGYDHIGKTPFILMMIRKHENVFLAWLNSNTELVVFLLLSFIIIILVVLWSSTYLVKHILAADQQRAKVLHNVEYTSKMATIGRLAASIAHEINNPLAIINEKAGLLKDLVLYTEDHPYRNKTLDALGSIINSVERCGGVTHRLLGFSKKLSIRFEELDLAEIMTEVMGFLGKEASHRNIEIQTHFPDEIPLITSVKGQLQQVFLNIINNAFAAVKDGGRIDLSLEKRDGDMVAAVISDSGTGITEEEIKNIFEPFYSTKGDFGTGLGLSITYGIVQKLGGQIEVESKLGEGTTFNIILPVKNTT